MNGKIQGIIVCVVVIFCLGATLIVLKFTGKDDNETSSAVESMLADDSKDETVSLIDVAAGDIEKLTAVNGKGGFTIVRSDSGKTTWTVAELDGFAQAENVEQRLMEDMTQLKAQKLVEENAKDLDKYGLKKPASTFTVTFADKGSRVFEIGNETPEKNNCRYLTEKDSNKVYTVFSTAVNEFIDGKEQFLNKEIIASREKVDFGTLTIKRPELDYDMKFVEDENEDTDMMSAQVMTSPIYSYLNGTTSQDVTHGIWGLTADSAVCLSPTDADKQKYGIDKPTAEVIYESGAEKYDLYIGSPIYSKNSEGENNDSVAFYYCYLDGVSEKDCIWKVSSESLPWADVLPEDIITTVMTYNNIADIDSIVVKNGSKRVEYTLASEDEQLRSAKIDGKPTDVENFKTFYQYFLSCPTTEIWYKEPEGEAFMSVEINAGAKSDKLEFYKDTQSERKAIVKRNGQSSFRIPLDWTKKFINNMDALEKGENILASY